MRFHVHDGACDALLPGAVGTLAGHPGGLGSPLTCGCGHDDCPHPTPEPAPAPEGADGAAPIEPPRIGHLWLVFAENQLTEAKRAERGTLPVPEPEPEVCPTCAGARVLQLEAQRNEHRLVVDVPELPPGATELIIPHGMSLEAEDARCPSATETLGQPGPRGTVPRRERLPCELPVGHPLPHRGTLGGASYSWGRHAEAPDSRPFDGDDTAEFEVESGADYADDYEPEPLVPELIEVQCPGCRGTGIAPPPPPPLIPNNPQPFRAGIRADLVELVYDRVDGVGGA